MDIQEIKQLLNALENSDVNRLQVKDQAFELVLEKRPNGPTGFSAQPSPGLTPSPSFSPSPIPASQPVGQSQAQGQVQGQGEVSLGPVVEEKAKEAFYQISSPIVGTFYSAPSPDQPDYVAVGDKVKKGQVVCIIEAMKLMNEIKSDIDGTVEAVHVTDEDGVEYGQALMSIRPQV